MSNTSAESSPTPCGPARHGLASLVLVIFVVGMFGCGSADDSPPPVANGVDGPITEPLAPAFDEELDIQEDPVDPEPSATTPNVTTPDATTPDAAAPETNAADAKPEAEKGQPTKQPAPTPNIEQPKPESPTATSPDPLETKPAEARPVDATPIETEPAATEGAVDAAARLEKQLAEFQIPPAWVSTVTSKWDVARKPWSEGRQEIRRLLGKSDIASRREGVKLTWDYLQKKDIGDGHEYGMYMFMGEEPLWAVIAYREYVHRPVQKYPPYFGLGALASLYAERGLFEPAEALLLRGLDMAPPKAEWVEMRKAEMHDELGDLYSTWDRADKAKQHYRESMKWYSKARPPYGRHLLPRRRTKVQTKLDLLSQSSLRGVSLRDGSYKENALGYSGDIKLTVTVRGGKVSDISMKHEEKIEQNATKIIPRRIIEKQSLQVDGISGATVTKDAIVAGTLRALRRAGLK